MILLLAGMACLTGIMTASVDAAQIVVFMESAGGVSNDVRMELGGLRLSGETGEYDLKLMRSGFTSSMEADHNHIIAETEIPPGRYDRIRVFIKEYTFLIQGAGISVPIVPEGIAIDLSIDMADDEAEPLFLVWTPEPDAAAAGSGPNIRIEYPTIPPSGSLAFVTNRRSGNVAVIDRHKMRLVDIIKVGDNPHGIVYSPGNQELYVASTESHSISVIDVNNLNVVQTIPLHFGDAPGRMLLPRNGETLYILNQGSNSLVGIDIRSYQETDRITLGTSPSAITVDAHTGNIFVSNSLSDNVSVFEPFSREIIMTFSSDGSPGELWAEAETKSLYLTYPYQRFLSVIDSKTGTRTATMNLCAPATGLVFNPVTRLLLVSQGRCSEIALLRPGQNLDWGGIPVPGEPGLLALDPENQNVLVILPKNNSLAFVNMNSRQVTAVIEVGQSPYLAVIPE